MFNLTHIRKVPRCYLPEYTVSFQNRYLKTTHMVTVPLNIICVLLSTVLNALVVIAVYRKHRLRTPSTVLLCSLNLKDTLLVPILQTITVYLSLVSINTGNFCARTQVYEIWLFLAIVYRSVALITMVLTSVDRWLAIGKPHLYRRAFTTRRVFLSLGAVWIFSLIFSAITSFLRNKTTQMQLLVVMFGVTAIIVAFFQVGVYFSIKRHGRRTAALRNSVKRHLTMERAASTVVTYVIIALAVCNIPLLSMYVVKLSIGKTYLLLTKPWMELVLYMNALANPLIWIKTNKNVRKAVFESVTTCHLFFTKLTPIHSVESTGPRDDASDKQRDLKTHDVRKETCRCVEVIQCVKEEHQDAWQPS